MSSLAVLRIEIGLNLHHRHHGHSCQRQKIRMLNNFFSASFFGKMVKQNMIQHEILNIFHFIHFHCKETKSYPTLNAGVNRGDRARTTEAADGNNPFKELLFPLRN